jgi:hypothetical protein
MKQKTFFGGEWMRTKQAMHRRHSTMCVDENTFAA